MLMRWVHRFTEGFTDISFFNGLTEKQLFHFV